MKLVGQIITVKVTNKSEGRIARGRFSLAHKEERIIETVRYSEDILRALENFHAIKMVGLTAVDNAPAEVKDESFVVAKESLKNDKGETHEHSVFDPETAKRNKLVEVEEIGDNSRAIKVADDFKEVKPSITKGEAEDFLAQHWKKVEKEVESIKDVGKLQFILSVANDLGMTGNKKHELVEERINALT